MNDWLWRNNADMNGIAITVLLLIAAVVAIVLIQRMRRSRSKIEKALKAPLKNSESAGGVKTSQKAEREVNG